MGSDIRGPAIYIEISLSLCMHCSCTPVGPVLVPYLISALKDNSIFVAPMFSERGLFDFLFEGV
jgi:hypothetical protein